MPVGHSVCQGRFIGLQGEVLELGRAGSNRVHQEVGGYAAFALNRGYHRRNTSSSSSFRTFVRVCSRRWAPRKVQPICCFFTNRRLTTWLMVDSTNAVLIVSPCRRRLPKFGRSEKSASRTRVNAGAMMLNLRCDHLFLQASQNCLALAYRQSHGGRRELLYTLNRGNFVLGGLARNHLRNQLQCPFHPNSLRHPTTLHALVEITGGRLHYRAVSISRQWAKRADLPCVVPGRAACGRSGSASDRAALT